MAPFSRCSVSGAIKFPSSSAVSVGVVVKYESKMEVILGDKWAQSEDVSGPFVAVRKRTPINILEIPSNCNSSFASVVSLFGGFLPLVL